MSRLLKELTATVFEAGLEGAAKNHAALIRKPFDSLMRFGEVLDQLNHLNIFRLEGQEIQKQAGGEWQRWKHYPSSEKRNCRVGVRLRCRDAG